MSVTSQGVANATTYGLGAHETLVANDQYEVLVGGAGTDIYQIGAHAQTDLIETWNNPSDATHSNTVDFSAANSDQLWFQRQGSDLLVSVIGTSTQADISGWYNSAANEVQQFTAADGKSLAATQVNALVQAMAAFAPPAAGVTQLPSNEQTALHPVLAASWH